MSPSNTIIFTQNNCIQSHILRFMAEVKQGLEFTVMDIVEHAALAEKVGITKAPAIRDRYLASSDLDILVEYFEEQHPEPALLPANVASRAIYRSQIRTFHRDVFPLLTNAKAGSLEAQGKLTEALRSMDAMTQGHAFFAGSQVSMLDVTLAPWLYAAQKAGMSLKSFPNLNAYATRMFNLPAFRATVAEEEARVAA